MKEKNNKKTIIIISSVLVLLLGLSTVLFFVFKNKSNNSFRLLKVMVVEGKANVNRKDTGDITPYENMVLESGDNVSLDTGKLTIKADEDKYVHLEENTEIELKATGDEKRVRLP